MTIKLIMHRFGAPIEILHDDLPSAIEDAEGQLFEGVAYPHEIYDDGKLIWKTSGPFEVATSLQQLKDLLDSLI